MEPKTLERQLISRTRPFSKLLKIISEKYYEIKAFYYFLCWFLCYFLADLRGEPTATVCWKAFHSDAIRLVPGYSCLQKAMKGNRTHSIFWEQLLLRALTLLFVTLDFEAARLLPFEFFAVQSTLLSDSRRKEVAYVSS